MKSQTQIWDDPSIVIRFWDRVDVGDDDECWNWIGSTNRQKKFNYGAMSIDNKTHKSNRLSWMIANRMEIPEGMHVLHKCDNTACANPGHLFLGTYSDNMQDCLSKGRFATGTKNGMSQKSRRERECTQPLRK